MTIANIVVATDGSPTAQRAVACAADIARSTGATVTAVHVFEPLALLGHVEPPVEFSRHEAAAQARLEGEWCEPLTQAGVKVVARVVEGTPAEAILQVVSEVGADLVVVGARGRSAVAELLLGSTSMALLHRAHRPVTVVPPQ